MFSTPDFDATQINPGTLTLARAPVKRGPNGKTTASFEDLNGDTLADLMLHFETSGLQLAIGDRQATLEGLTFAGIRVLGVDSVRIVD